MTSRVLLPEGWAQPIGYANGIETTPGKILFLAGQVGWDASQKFRSEELVPQFEQALRNVVQVLAAAGGQPDHICRITAYCTDKRAYLDGRGELGRIWRRLMGRHYPAMTLVFVVDLLDHPATAVIPAAR
jgi:enamine deaminase RidA (YjgF/YER057c/UK114 family)